MKKILCFLISLNMITFSLIAAPQAIVFDFGGVLTGEPNREAVINFIQQSFSLSREEFDVVNQEKRLAAKMGKTDEEFWLAYAEKKEIELPSDWGELFHDVLKDAIGVNPRMYVLVEELRKRQMPIALLSNIDERLSKLIRNFGLYEPFSPCLLSCEIGIEKPDPKAYETLLTKLGLPAKDVLFIDDRFENVDAAKKIGFDAILFKSEHDLRNELNKRGVLVEAYAVIHENANSFAGDEAVNIQNLLQEYVEDNGTPGAAVAFIDSGNVQFFSCGKMSIDGQPVSKETIFEIGSITKVFTTLALMDMAVKGEVQLDDPIEKYLPGVRVPELDGKKITLRHLATHTSGIPRMPDNFAPKDPTNPYQDYTVESLYNFLQSCTLRKPPGESIEYSNVGMGLLGHILSVRSGKSYEKLIQEVITNQLYMPNTSISISDTMTPHFATGHHMRQAVSHWDLPPSFAGAGALRSNIKDMANFLAANMGLLKSPLNNVLQKCHEKQSSSLEPGFSTGLGWVLSITDIIWHNGGTGGFRSYLGFNLKTQKGIVILTNSTEDWPDEFGQLMLNPDYRRPVVDKMLANNPGYLNKFIGSYEAFLSAELPQQQLQISVFGKLLTLALSEGEVGMLFPESYGVFGIKGFPDGKVIFSFDGSGNISQIEARLISNGTILWRATPLSNMTDK